MNNPITYALKEIHNAIPKQILERTFHGARNQPVTYANSLDSIIKEKVIINRVVEDCNLIGGTEADISLKGLNPLEPELGCYVWNIPKDRTNSRNIVSFLALCYSQGNNLADLGNQATVGYPGAVGLGYQRMTNSHMPIPVVQNANCSVVSPNTLMVRGEISRAGSFYARVLLENDSNMNNLSTHNYGHFAQLCIFATKAYIYNNLIIPMDTGFIQSGAQLGRFSEVVNEYSDSNQLYKEYFDEIWGKVSMLNDHVQSQRHYGLVGGGI